MKKFKLIKIYPKSPELGSVVRIESDRSGAKLYCPNDKILRNASFGTYWVTEPKYSEFWEEIIEYVKCVKSVSGAYTLNKIYKVDGDFVLSNNNLKITNLTFHNKQNNNSQFISSTKEDFDLQNKPKIALYKTEDGIDIYENTNFYWVNTSANQYNLNKANSNIKYYFQPCHKLFLTKEKAEEYIKNNKPQYNLEQIAECLLMFDKKVNDYTDIKLNYMQKALNYLDILKNRK